MFRIAGSSPLARGLLRHPLSQCVEIGIIPARAGFTPATPSPAPTTPDHPRSRGVYNHTVDVYKRLYGSSPLARGLPPYDGAGAFDVRIIPARAGFTHGDVLALRAPWDHPRSRGVY